MTYFILLRSHLKRHSDIAVIASQSRVEIKDQSYGVEHVDDVGFILADFTSSM
jgi:hypothetical protein